MLTKTQYTVNRDLIDQACSESIGLEFKQAVNEPSGNFFYDPWVIKKEFKDTVWDRILQTLSFNVGEARIITLPHGKCYQSHGDIDDRYHLNISSHYAYIINLETEKMYPLMTDCIWYEMDAGPRHTAVNFGYSDRIQLVVRKLLDNNLLENGINIKMFYSDSDKDKVRFIFDDIISPWLNKSYKEKTISDFSYQHNDVRFKITESKLSELKNLLPKHFNIEIL